MTLASPMVSRSVETGCAIPRGSGRAPRASCPGSSLGPRVRVGRLRRSAGLSAPRPTSVQRARSSRRDRAGGGTPALSTSTREVTRAVFTYAQLLHEVKRVSAALRGLGVAQGRSHHDLHADLARKPIMLMLAVRPHRRDPLGRLRRLRRAGPWRSHSASGSRLVFTADVTYRRGQGRSR